MQYYPNMNLGKGEGENIRQGVDKTRCSRPRGNVLTFPQESMALDHGNRRV